MSAYFLGPHVVKSSGLVHLPSGQYAISGLSYPALTTTKNLSATLRCKSDAYVVPGVAYALAAQPKAKASLTISMSTGKEYVDPRFYCKASTPRCAIADVTTGGGTTPDVVQVGLTEAFAAAKGMLDYDAATDAVVDVTKSGTTVSLRYQKPDGTAALTTLWTDSSTAYVGQNLTLRQSDNARFVTESGPNLLRVYKQDTTQTFSGATLYGSYPPSITNPYAITYSPDANRIFVFWYATYTTAGKSHQTLHASSSVNGGSSWVPTRVGAKPLTGYITTDVYNSFILRAHPTNPDRIYIVTQYYAAVGAITGWTIMWYDCSTFTSGVVATSNTSPTFIGPPLIILPHGGGTASNAYIAGISSTTYAFRRFTYDYTSATAWQTPTIAEVSATALSTAMGNRQPCVGFRKNSTTGMTAMWALVSTSTSEQGIYAAVDTGSGVGTAAPSFTTTTFTDTDIAVNFFSASLQRIGRVTVDDETMPGYLSRSSGADLFRHKLLRWGSTTYSYRVHLLGTLASKSNLTATLQSATSVPLSGSWAAHSSLSCDLRVGTTHNLAAVSGASSSLSVIVTTGGIRLVPILACISSAALDLRVGQMMLAGSAVAQAQAAMRLGVAHHVDLSATGAGHCTAQAALLRGVTASVSMGCYATAQCGLSVVRPLAVVLNAQCDASVSLSIERWLSGFAQCKATATASLTVVWPQGERPDSRVVVVSTSSQVIAVCTCEETIHANT